MVRRQRSRSALSCRILRRGYFANWDCNSFLTDRLHCTKWRESSGLLGRVGLSVYSAIERTPAAHAFAQALAKHLGPNASKTKRTEHIFLDPEEVRSLVKEAGFEDVEVTTVSKQIEFPSMSDYIRFQLIATPMAALTQDK